MMTSPSKVDSRSKTTKKEKETSSINCPPKLTIEGVKAKNKEVYLAKETIMFTLPRLNFKNENLFTVKDHIIKKNETISGIAKLYGLIK